jgi:transcriptional regulator with XRE-family HTH domain
MSYISKLNTAGLIGRGITTLRGRFGLTQPQFAARFGFNLSSLQKWERGRHPPRGDQLLRILALCPDDECRRMFDVDAEVEHIELKIQKARIPLFESRVSGRPVTDQSQARAELQQKKFTPEQEERMRRLSDAMLGLQLIYEAAEAGSGAADELLAYLQDQLNARGGDWRRIKYLRQRKKGE